MMMKIFAVMEKKRNHLVFENDLTKFYDILKLSNKTKNQLNHN